MKKEQRYQESKRKHPSRWNVLALVVATSFIVVIGVYYIIPVFDSSRQFANLSSWISIWIESWTLVMAIVIAVYIYERQKQDSELEASRKQEVAVSLMGEMVEDGVKWLINGMEFHLISECYAIKENLNKYGEIMIDYLPSLQFRTLAQMAETINAAIQNDFGEDSIVDRSFLFRDWLRPLMLSSYRGYSLFVEDEYALLHKDILNLMKSLRVIPADKDYPEGHIIWDKSSNKLFEETESMAPEAEAFAQTVYDIYRDWEFLEEMKRAFDYVPSEKDVVRIPDFSGPFMNIFYADSVVFSGGLGFDNLDSAKEGFVRTIEYQGFKKNFLCEGMGIEYDKSGHKFKEGIWQSGELIAGKEYNWIVLDKNNALRYNPEIKEYEGDENTELVEYLQYDHRMLDPLMDLRTRLIELGLEYFYVTDMKTLGLGKPLSHVNIRTLRDFLKEEDPEILRRLEREMEWEEEE